ncbi:hepatic triacylglycerol lipase-like [Daktulosphaira vitifoliae]|uniref:hepatic triacylglycerol lipase-like n=1 Tax=Daktulosphaira vitifoliae TaxID=58002 RepID=UPI0021A9F200|nr:hepatic triacylglycerol lipase-like [Daktulosphaira vitifoliae]XP_050542884.1 hepatic triacylglycerol lipase-like [Daktulosphaira vitifoliae]
MNIITIIFFSFVSTTCALPPATDYRATFIQISFDTEPIWSFLRYMIGINEFLEAEDDHSIFSAYSISHGVDMFLMNDRTYLNPDEVIIENLPEVARKYDKNLPLKVLINGWSSDNNVLKDILIPAYMETRQNKVNILLVDWTALDQEHYYPKSSLVTGVVGEMVADMLITMVRIGMVKVDDIHIIGYSMGAHIAAIIGEKLKTSQGEPTVGRITGIDPITPCVENSSVVDNCLNKSRARFVDVVQTFTEYEQGNPIGTADFYLKISPDKDEDSNKSKHTNEIKNVQLFSNSIRNSNVLTCCMWDDFSESLCGLSKPVIMGEHLNKMNQGKYYCHDSERIYKKIEM